MWEAKAIITRAPWGYASSAPPSPARNTESKQQCKEVAWTVSFEITSGASELDLWNCELQLCMWDLQTGITLDKPPGLLQEHDCATRDLGNCAVSPRCLEIWTRWLHMVREEGLSYCKAAAMNTAHSHPETWQWKVLEVPKWEGDKKF